MITARLQHIQYLTKTPEKFQNDLDKVVGRVAFTRYPVSNALGQK